jgi:hypothetical protein
MKTTKLGLVYFMLLSVAILILSCTKDQMVTKNPNVTPVAAGSIVDLGAVSGDVHRMSVTLSGVAMIMPGTSGDNPVASDVNLELFTGSDGIIQDGTYTFSDTGDMAPFTFKSATLNTPDQSALAISAGNITVSRRGTSYTFTLDGTVSSGDAISGDFDGMLLYSDAVSPY